MSPLSLTPFMGSWRKSQKLAKTAYLMNRQAYQLIFNMFAIKHLFSLDLFLKCTVNMKKNAIL